ncbi:hypothetical protein [Streptomyces sp. NPDC005301]|uniref:hypothetical protein n=1 Tax=Streptomyces sp. NPDC005301 TaxID=3156874 RepID=UPI0033BA164B
MTGTAAGPTATGGARTATDEDALRAGLRGRGPLFGADPPGLAARLVGRTPYRHGPVPQEHARTSPFVLLTGARGLGGTTVLRELRESFRGHVPVALIDGADSRRAAGPPRPPEAWSPVAQALADAAEQLAEPVSGAGRLQFPRLACGLLAVAAGGWGDRDETRVRRESERVLLLNDSGSWVPGLTGRWVGRVVTRLTDTVSGTGQGVEPLIEAALEAFSEGVSPTHLRLRKGATWYRDCPDAGGSPKLGLVLLSGRFRAGGDSRARAERHLVRALLADLDDAYAGPLQRTRRTGRPLVLVDDVQAAPGLALMEAVLRDRADGFPDPAVFFAALRGPTHPALRDAARRTLPDLARHTGWTPGTSPSSGALLVPLPPLAPDDTAHLLGAACRPVPVPPHLPPAVHRLTGGSPLGVALFAECARQNPAAASPGALLTASLVLPGDHEARPLHRELLDRLMPAGVLDALTVLAAAHDRDSAHALAAARLPDGSGAPGVRDLEELLAREGRPAAGGHFVGDPFLRALLLLRLHRLDPGRLAWRAAHRALVRHFTDPPGDAGGPGRARLRLHHELALGDTEGAVAHLRDTFARADCGDWLSSLLFIASAPYHPGPDGRDRRTPVALGRTDPAVPPPDGTHGALHLRTRRLLHALWRLTDPLVPPDPEMGRRVRSELEELSQARPADGAALRRAARDWPADALAGRPPRTPDASGDTAGER